MANNNTKIVNTSVRGVGNVVFYVQEIQKQSKDGKWNNAGFIARVKHSRDGNAFPFDNCPTNEELKKIWHWNH